MEGKLHNLIKCVILLRNGVSLFPLILSIWAQKKDSHRNKILNGFFFDQNFFDAQKVNYVIFSHEDFSIQNRVTQFTINIIHHCIFSRMCNYLTLRFYITVEKSSGIGEGGEGGNL